MLNCFGSPPLIWNYKKMLVQCWWAYCWRQYSSDLFIRLCSLSCSWITTRWGAEMGSAHTPCFSGSNYIGSKNRTTWKTGIFILCSRGCFWFCATGTWIQRQIRITEENSEKSQTLSHCTAAPIAGVFSCYSVSPSCHLMARDRAQQVERGHRGQRERVGLVDSLHIFYR